MSQATSHSTQHTQTDERPIATTKHFEIFEEIVEHRGRICNNCFAEREKGYSHYRSSGGRATGGSSRDDKTCDRFCTECFSGTGEPTLHRPHDGEAIHHDVDDRDEPITEVTSDSGRIVDYSNVHSQLSASFQHDMGGTLGREWSEIDPLPKNGERLSLFQNLQRLRDRLEDLGYDVNWRAWKRNAAAFKNRSPRKDRAIFARMVAETVNEAD